MNNLLSDIGHYLRETIYRIFHWESWHWFIKYIPILPVWLWFCLRARSFWFFSASNPTLTFGGFDGETKREMYEHLPTHCFPKTYSIRPGTPDWVLKRLVALEFSFPLAVKPDVGRMGLMFRRINSYRELCEYNKVMTESYLLQEFVEYPLEVSVFYYRFPGQLTGTITGFLKKEYLSVIGDGRSTLRELIRQYRRVRFRLDEMKAKHGERLNNVIPSGEKYILSYALNLSRGGKLVSLEHAKDEKLLALFDELSHFTGFYFGRYDIKCSSVDELKNARNFSIIEFNGSGAEPHHVYGNGNSLLKALKILVSHWHVLYLISRANNRNGIRYWSFKNGFAHFKESVLYFKKLKALDAGTSDVAPKKQGKQERTPYLKPGLNLSAAMLSSYVNSKN